MASDRHPYSKQIFNPNAYPSFPKSDPIFVSQDIVELPADDLIDAGNTRPLQVASIHAAAAASGPGRATPFTPPPPAPVYPEPVMIPPQTPPPVALGGVGYGTMPSVAWQGQQPEPSQSYVQMAPQQQYQQQAYPSFAPTAMDVQQQHYAQQQQPKKKSRAGLIVGIILGVGFFGLLAVGGGGFAYWKYYLEPAAEEALTATSQNSNTNSNTNATDTTPAATATPAASTPAVAINTPAATATTAKVNPLPVLTTNKATTSTTSKSTSAHVATTTTAKSDAKVEPKADPKADAKTETTKTETTKTETTKTDAAGEGGTGTVRSYTAEAGKPITIDGAMAGVAPAPLTVTCGSHQIQVGSAKVKTINVPCGGSVTVGSPDGT